MIHKDVVPINMTRTSRMFQPEMNSDLYVLFYRATPAVI